MRTLALEAGSAQVNEELPFLTTYRCLWVRFPTSASPDLRPGITSETHGYQAATQLFSSEGTTVTGVYERLEKPTRQRIRHTQADQEALVRRWAHLPLTPSKKFTMGDAYRNRVEAGLVSLEEGVVEHWSWGSRVVLAGDAAHKFTPSTGAGCNHGIADVVALANELHKVVQEAHGEAPKAEQIETAFRAYQETRRETTVQVCQRAGNATASATWGSWVLKFVDLYLLPREMMQSRITKGNAALTSRTPVFNYLPGEEPLMGKVPWLNPVPSTGSRQGMVSDIVGMYE